MRYRNGATLWAQLIGLCWFGFACASVPTATNTPLPSPTATPVPGSTLLPPPTATPTKTAIPVLLLSSAPIKADTISDLSLLGTLEQDGYHLQSWAFSGDGGLLAAASYEQVVQVWDVATLQEMTTMAKGGDLATQVFAGPDGQILVTKENLDATQISDAFTDRLEYTIGGLIFLGEMAASRDGNLVATLTDASRNITLWELPSQKKVQTIYGDWEPYDTPFTLAHTVFFSPDSSFLAASVTGGTSIVWDVGSGERVKDFENADVLAFSPDESLLAARVDGSQIALFDTTNWEQVQLIKNSDIVIGSAVFSKDSEILITFARDGIIAFWDWASGTVLHTLEAFTDVTSIEHPDGYLYVAGSWALLLLSPDGTVLVSYSTWQGEKFQFWGVP